ncbi:hypothetical protein KY290_017137 [Solanum tuberosum]|uniref:Integrase core domain containing protein n=1 Tax=Solanum tuberosum TaxID=4113 RepID=A0ABQ7VC29_SOLTU|nr:hypothetical protein KY284_016173 [Solanum tuberosum]KAH0689032.1 hypothetical protein KY289_016390 [Solanum tuberosum]KAH0704297.1 hypothetical protein KY285_018575 [Solanum tuberosum]KAH0761064.1 hypothetical protein KY290_017137 [Solanum tuberosum]
MARGKGRGKSFGRNSPAIHVSMPTILMPTIVCPQQGGTTTVETSAQSTTPTISETLPVIPNQSSPIGQGLSTQSIPTGCSIPIAKGGGVRPGFVPEHVWERWTQLWGSNESKKKSETNAKNRRGGREVAAGTHTCGSISIGEHSKKLEKYEEILREKTTSQSDIDQCEAYYQAAGGEKKKRIYGLGSEAKTYYGQNLCASSSVAPSVSQSTSIRNMDVFVKEMIPSLTNHFLPVIMERVQQVVTPIDNPSLVTPMVPPPATTNEDEVDPLVSSDEGIP